MGIFLFGLRKRKRNDQKLRKGEGPEESNDEELELPMYDLAIVTKATNSFSNSNKLGEGGFGPVYKGMLEDGQEIIRSDQTRMNGIGLTSRSDVRLQPPTDAPCHLS